jgi:hypothetical protein
MMEKANCGRLQKLRESPTTALAIVTCAFVIDMATLLACVPVLPMYATNLGIHHVQIGLIFSARSIAVILSSTYSI